MIHKVFLIFCEIANIKPSWLGFYLKVCEYFLKLFFFHKSRFRPILDCKPFHGYIKKRLTWVQPQWLDKITHLSIFYNFFQGQQETDDADAD